MEKTKNSNYWDASPKNSHSFALFFVPSSKKKTKKKEKIERTNTGT
jgi:hypothetical protein